LFAESGTASKFDTAGRSIWPSNLFVMTNAENTNALQVASDNNGGGIIAFWNTIGGIYAQHTGRSGRIGIITDASFEEPSVFNYQLSQNFPNPFNPSTTIRFSMTRRALVTLKVFDLLGEEVVTLLNQQLAVGEHEVKWDASRFGGCFKLS
jgi:hypothetical protein